MLLYFQAILHMFYCILHKKVIKYFENFYDNFEVPLSLFSLLDKSIYEEPPIGLKEGFLIKEGFALLGRDGKKMQFADTERLQKVLNHLPTKLKFLRKVGLIDG